MSLVRMRFAKDALAELKKLDPDTPVTLSLIKRLIKSGAVPSVPVKGGRCRAVNLDALIEYLNNYTGDESAVKATGIRPIPESLKVVK